MTATVGVPSVENSWPGLSSIDPALFHAHSTGVVRLLFGGTYASLRFDGLCRKVHGKCITAALARINARSHGIVQRV